jgi:UDP-3-O-[3-hydroxymyristoyl] glucosamine N-acyltransferase
VGKNTVIAAQTGISGSTKIGENCMLAGQVGIAGHLVIANNTGLGAQVGVSKSIKEPGKRWMGSPAIDFSEYFKSYAVFKKLPDINHRLRELEAKLQNVQTNSLSVD